MRNNTALTSLDLADLESIDLLRIEDNPALSQLRLPFLRTVDVLRVKDNPLLDTTPLGPVLTFESEMVGNAAP